MADTFQWLDGSIQTTLDFRSYRLSAIKKAAYRFADRCTVILGAPAENGVDVTIAFKPGMSEPLAREVLRQLFQELLDQELREAIAEEIAPVRTLILAHAFSKTNLVRHD
ncbi:His-Xaa-Ser system protein HxsD [Pendulispora albinea]|uniref:His-Xaa-Ser system protein HxsD n=1 Tax=Pendulispora albinea TaxID=2741071 RepID=A0ABZ2LZV9_9BACT